MGADLRWFGEMTRAFLRNHRTHLPATPHRVYQRTKCILEICNAFALTAAAAACAAHVARLFAANIVHNGDSEQYNDVTLRGDRGRKRGKKMHPNFPKADGSEGKRIEKDLHHCLKYGM